MKKTRKINTQAHIKLLPTHQARITDEILTATPTTAIVAEELLLPIEPQIEQAIIPQEATAEQTGMEHVWVAILSEDGFEEEELTSPKEALENAGAHVDVISSHDGKIKAWNKTEWGKEVDVDVQLSDAKPTKYDAIILPGGVMNPDKLRQNVDAVLFLRQFIRSGKPVAAICHGTQTLIETGMIKGKTMTSYPSLRTDLTNAGVNWVDMDVVHYGQFITSRRPADLEAFNREIIYALSLRGH